MDDEKLSFASHQESFAIFKNFTSKITIIVVTHLPIAGMNAKALYFDHLPRATQKAFQTCSQLDLFRKHSWYLAGGTGLSLQTGHRKSVDLDFFTPLTSFRTLSVERALFQTGAWQTTLQEEGTIYGILHQAKMSLIAYPFFKPSSRRITYGTISILVPRDIAAMKIIAISQRGRKRDFVDLYWYCLHCESLQDIITYALRHYPGQSRNMIHLLKSLTYFVDADQDPMPEIFFKADWKGIKNFFQREVKNFTKSFKTNS
jgi:hypothetical protein